MYCTNINFDASPQFYATTRLDVNTPLYTNVRSTADTQFELLNIIQLRLVVVKHRPQLSATPAVNATDHKKQYSKIPMWITAKVTSYPHGDFISVSHHD
ncbi:hypothetical protein EFP25_07600 [Lactiplantibacillus pentosus]|nr:hypothetical protein [Lactiplantibacillus pentosus]MCT3299476.1 hypothetical protein [Lactiplantibacillus pentosus]MCT3313864.1 hypothetical protein [Lactiplantibacillus pentosus]MCT3327760.1 hypothetical protein [Lactiplantibacillus pentosus]GEO49398.1 hypothetical protein LPE01_07590 [Lactiplantibacillus pentosus]